MLGTHLRLWLMLSVCGCGTIWRPSGRPTPPAQLDAGVTADFGEQVVYPFEARHSPLPPSVVANLRRIAGLAQRNNAAFSKVGDSNTVHLRFLTCFAGAKVDLDGRTGLQSTLDHFKASGSFTRASEAATVGWTSGSVLTGTPSALDREVAAFSPRYAVVLLGTNDIGNGSSDAFTFARNMFAITDRLIASGVIPILSTLPPLADAAAADERALELDAVVRGIAQARQVPLVDLGRAMRRLPSRGLGPDGLHFNVHHSGGVARGCDFSNAGLAHGHNTRNLLVLEALARARAAVDFSIPADENALRLQGAGTAVNPFVVAAVPFVDFRDTANGALRASAVGPEYLYRLVVSEPTSLKIQAVSFNGAQIEVHLISDLSSAEGCVMGNSRQLVTTLQPGTWWLSVDTRVVAGAPKSGEYLLTIVRQ